VIDLHLIRHGETEWHAENRYAGRSDIRLTDRGLRQAAALAASAPRLDLGLVASSQLRRAVETAAPLAAAAGVPHRVDARFEEVDFGRGEGLTRDEMGRRFPVDLDAFLARPASHPLPGGEPGAAAVERAFAGLAALVAEHREDAGAIALVAHTTLIRLMLCTFLGLPLDEYRRRFPVVGNVTVTTVRVDATPVAAELIASAGLIAFNMPLSDPEELPAL
jgi:broad specificity phosphatase PhoE